MNALLTKLMTTVAAGYLIAAGTGLLISGMYSATIEQDQVRVYKNMTERLYSFEILGSRRDFRDPGQASAYQDSLEAFAALVDGYKSRFIETVRVLPVLTSLAFYMSGFFFVLAGIRFFRQNPSARRVLHVGLGLALLALIMNISFIHVSVLRPMDAISRISVSLLSGLEDFSPVLGNYMLLLTRNNNTEVMFHFCLRVFWAVILPLVFGLLLSRPATTTEKTPENLS